MAEKNVLLTTKHAENAKKAGTGIARDTMPTAVDRVVDQVLDLPAEARIGLVDRILSSLNLPTRPDIDRLWAEEAERRVAHIHQGEVELIPGNEVFAKIRRKHTT